jgi:PTS system IIA component, Glc family (TC 4.A.1)
MFRLFKKIKRSEKPEKVIIKSPVNGRCFSVKEVPDEAFSTLMMGDGIGFESSDGILYAPVSGEILQVFPTKHAAVIRTHEGLEILLHVGVETVSMKGEGFEAFVKKGDKVSPGDKLIAYDIQLIRQKAKSDLSPMIITNMDMVDSIDFHYGEVTTDSVVMEITLK